MNTYACADLLDACLESLAPPLISHFASTFSHLGSRRIIVKAWPGVCVSVGDRLFLVLSHHWHDLFAENGYVVLEV